MFFVAQKQQKTILNSILNILSDSKFVTGKQNIVNDQSNTNYVQNQTIYNTKILKSSLCDYNDAYILVKRDITVTAAPETHVSFKNCAPFTRCITKIDGTTIDDAKDLDLVMPMYNQIILKQQEVYGFILKMKQLILMEILLTIIILDFLSLAELLGNTKAQPNSNQANGILKNAAIAVPLKYLPNFWRSLEMPLIIWKVELKLKWTKYCVLSAAGNDDVINNASYIIFTIKGTKSYVPFVIVSARDNQKLSNFLGKGFERSVFWNEYKIKSEK